MSGLAMLEQGSDAWRQVRCGKLTASCLHEAIARTKSGWGASRANLLARLVAERLTGVPADGFTNAAMQWGTEREPEARAAYSFMRDVDAATVGFVEHPSIAMSGASPDGLVGKDGLVEIKCPGTATHIETLLGGSVPAKYVTQMLWQMACTGRAWCDFVSYDPRMPEELRLFVRRVERDDTRIEELEVLARAFLVEVDETVAKLQALSAPEPGQGGRRWDALRPSQQAGIRCGEVAFRRFLGAEDEADAATLLRARLAVGSRRDLDGDPAAAERWRAVEAEYWNWRNPQVAA